MRPCVFIHTNQKQNLGALVSAYSVGRKSRHADRFDVRIIRAEDFPFLAAREGQRFLRGDEKRVWTMDDLQSFTPLRFLPPELMGYQGRALIIDPDIFAVGDVWELLDRDFFGDKPTATKRTDGAIAGMVQTFNDPYTFFVEPRTRELERDQLAGKFGGIGASLEQTDAGYVLSPLAGQPADRAGVRKGDLLLMVDGHEITAQMTTDDVIALLRGPVGASITLVARSL